MLRFVNCVRLTPVADGKLETVSMGVELSVSGICEGLAATEEGPGKPPNPNQLRALVHDDELYIGLAAGAGPISIMACPDHPIILRGPTLFFPLNCSRPAHEATLNDVRLVEPATPEGLTWFESFALNGEAEGGYELRPWRDRSEAAQLPNLKSGLRREGSDFGAKNLAELLAEALGSEVEVFRLGKDGNLEQLGGGPSGPEVRGQRAFDTYSIERMLRNDAPKKHTRMLEVPAYVTSLTNHFPHPAAAVLSMLTFYLQLLNEQMHLGAISPEDATERINAVLRIKLLIEDEHKPENRGKEWPLTVDNWLPEGWDKR